MFLFHLSLLSVPNWIESNCLLYKSLLSNFRGGICFIIVKFYCPPCLQTLTLQRSATLAYFHQSSIIQRSAQFHLLDAVSPLFCETRGNWVWRLFCAFSIGAQVCLLPCIDAVSPCKAKFQWKWCQTAKYQSWDLVEHRRKHLRNQVQNTKDHLSV